MNLSRPILFFALMSLAACTKKQAPAEESREGLEQALKGVEQAEEGFKRMREKSETLQQQVNEQTELLDATIAKHVALLKGRVDAEEKRIAGLSAERQTALLPLLADLKQQMSGVEAAFQGYRQASPEKAEELNEKMRTVLESLNTTFSQLDAKVRESEAR